MSTSYALKAEKRERAGKGVARTLRRENKVPGVIYGDSKEAVTITLPSKEINLEYRKGHMFQSLCNLEAGGEKFLVLARDVQLDPVTDVVLHVDFLRVTPKTQIHVQVPVHFNNAEECPGLKEKGVLNIVRHEIEVVCRATDIPTSIEVDLSTVQLGDSIHIGDLKFPDGAKPIDKESFTVAAIHAPRRAAEVEATPAAEGAEGAEAAAGDAAKEGDK
jgi:large subunit ribosomal protein L25